MKKIRRLGASAVSSSRIDDRAEMANYLESIRSEIEGIMNRKGLSSRTEELFQALRNGDVTEGQLGRGDVVQWMVFRQNGKVGVGRGPYCIDSAESYETFEVSLVDETDLGDTIERTTTTFVIPKICANLALGDIRTETVAKPKSPPPSASTSTPPPAPPSPPPVVPPPAPSGTTTSTTTSDDPSAAMEDDGKRSGRSGDSRWTIRAFPLRTDVDDDALNTDDGAERSHFAFSNGNGAGFNVEYRKSDRLGLEGGLLYSKLDSFFMFDSATEWLMDEDSSSFLALTFGPNFHLTPNQKLDFYVGPFVGLAQIGDATYNLNGVALDRVTREFDDEFMFGLQLGLDIPFGESPWAFHVGGLYMDLSAGGNGGDVSLNPLIGTIGLAYDF